MWWWWRCTVRQRSHQSLQKTESASKVHCWEASDFCSGWRCCLHFSPVYQIDICHQVGMLICFSEPFTGIPNHRHYSACKHSNWCLAPTLAHGVLEVSCWQTSDLVALSAQWTAPQRCAHTTHITCCIIPQIKVVIIPVCLQRGKWWHNDLQYSQQTQPGLGCSRR